MKINESVLVTGFPGFIAGRLIENLAAEGSELMLLVQPSLREKAEHDLSQRNRSEDVRKRIHILEGDITEENLGLSLTDLHNVKSRVTSVFHLAAAYDLGVKRELAMRVNFNGTRNVNRLVRSLPKLLRYNYISTCYVAGKRRGVIAENELQHDAGFRNYYEESKYLAETDVATLKSELPVTIHRPAVVCGDSLTGEAAKFDGIYYLINYLLRMPRFVGLFNIGNEKVSLNLVPVDFVVNAIAALSQCDEAVGKTLQIADPAPLSTYKLFDAIAVTIHGRPSQLTFSAPVVHLALAMPLSPILTKLPHPAVPYFFIRQTYDTRVSSELLSRYGMSCPPFPSYVDKIVKYAAAHR